MLLFLLFFIILLIIHLFIIHVFIIHFFIIHLFILFLIHLLTLLMILFMILLIFLSSDSPPVSSTRIRTAVRRGDSVKYLLPRGVVDYIGEKDLYET